MTETVSALTITVRQRRVVKLIERHWKENGYAPTVRELSRELGFASPVGVQCHLTALRKKGVITWQEHTSRTIRLTGAAI